MDLDDLPQPERETTVPPDDLEVDGENPNEMSDEQFGLFCDRIRNEGWLGGAILTDLDGLIADGEHRMRAAEEVGLSAVPVRQYDIDDATRRLWRQEMNKNEGTHDKQRDALEYNKLLHENKSAEVHELTRAAGENLDELLESIKDDPPFLDGPPPEDESGVDIHEGDVWGLGDHRFVCGDATANDTIDRLFGNIDTTGRPDVVTILDPPYQLADRLWLPFVRDPTILFGQARHIRYIPDDLWRFERVLIKADGQSHRSATVQINHRHAFVCQIGSEKVLPSDKSHTADSVVEMDDETDHQAKPPQLLVDHLSHWTPRGDVFDPFLGGGSSLLAAERVGRRCLGVELDPDRLAETITRGQHATNIDAELLDRGAE